MYKMQIFVGYEFHAAVCLLLTDILSKFNSHVGRHADIVGIVGKEDSVCIVKPLLISLLQIF